MIVDDDESVRFLLRRLATRHVDCEIVGEASDGSSAAELAERVRPDVVILDVHMPKLDGIEAIPRILAGSPGSRIVMFSSDPTRRETALARGADRWCSKTDGFESVVQTALDLATSG